MQFCGRTEIVWVSPRDDTGSAWTATACGQERLGIATALFREGVNIRSPRGGISVAAVIVPPDVIRNEDDEVGPFGMRNGRKEES